MIFYFRESDIKFSWTQPNQDNFVPPKVCDFVKENGTVDYDEASSHGVGGGAAAAGGNLTRTKRNSDPYYSTTGNYQSLFLGAPLKFGLSVHCVTMSFCLYVTKSGYFSK